MGFFSKKIILEVSLTQESRSHSEEGGESKLVVETENAGKVPVTLQEAGVITSDGRKIAFSLESEGSTEIKANEILKASKTIPKFLELLQWEGYRGDIELRPYACDVDGKIHQGYLMEIDIDAFSMKG